MAKVRLRPSCCCSCGRFEGGYITFLERHSLALQPNPEHGGRTFPAKYCQRGGARGGTGRGLLQAAQAFLSPAAVSLHRQGHEWPRDPCGVRRVAGVLGLLRLLGREAAFSGLLLTYFLLTYFFLLVTHLL